MPRRGQAAAGTSADHPHGRRCRTRRKRERKNESGVTFATPPPERTERSLPLILWSFGRPVFSGRSFFARCLFVHGPLAPGTRLLFKQLRSQPDAVGLEVEERPLRQRKDLFRLHEIIQRRANGGFHI